MNVGHASLALALLAACWGIAAVIVGLHRGDERLLASARRSTYVVTALALVCFAIVEAAYLRDDFRFALVAGNSSTTTPLFYKLTAAWASQAGSLLLWLVILSAQASVAVRIAHRRYRALAPVATLVLLVVCGFFMLLMLGWSSPFEASVTVPAEGAGLQPLLRYPLMAIHPVALYLGYAGFTVPFAFAVAALATGRLDAAWLLATRRFTMAAWGFLAVGLVLGARWSYAELGWGGYWGWDPVENAALLPWLTGTALLHSSLVQEKRGMLKIWNVSLVMASFVLALTGTFLVRSGILNSIHAFGASTLGVPFVVAIATAIALSIGLVVWRARDLGSEHRLDSLLSREAVFLLNNLVLVGLAFVVLWGTFFPLVSEALTGTAAAVGPPWFTRFATPLGIVLVLLTGLGPLFAWRRTTPRRLARVLVLPVLASIVLVAVLLIVLRGPSRPAALATFAMAAFTGVALCGEVARATSVRRAVSGETWPTALFSLVRRNRRRYGGYLVHGGFAALLLGVAASSSFATVKDQQMRPGDRMAVAGYEVTYRRARPQLSVEKLTFGTIVDVRRAGRLVTTLAPARELYPSPEGSASIVQRYFSGEQTSEIGLDPGLLKDVWIAVQPDFAALQPVVEATDRRFGSSSPETQALVIATIQRHWATGRYPVMFRTYVRPGVTWLWLGAAVVAAGTLIAAAPAPRRRRREPERRVGEAVATAA